MKKTALAILFVAAGIAAYLWYSRQPAEAPPASEAHAGDIQVDFELKDLDGNVHRLSEWNGKARLVNFWATWCAPCRREIPLLKKTQAEYGDGRLQVIGVAVDFPEDVAAYAKDADFNYPILAGQEDAMAAAGESGIEFVGLPFTLIVAPDGRLIKAHLGEILEEDIQRILTVLGRLQSGAIDADGARQALADL